MGKTVKRKVIDATKAEHFFVNLTIHVAIVGAIEASKPLKAPYGKLGEEGIITNIDDKLDNAADKYYHCILAKNNTERTSFETAMTEWKEKYKIKMMITNLTNTI